MTRYVDTTPRPHDNAFSSTGLGHRNHGIVKDPYVISTIEDFDEPTRTNVVPDYAYLTTRTDIDLFGEHCPLSLALDQTEMFAALGSALSQRTQFLKVNPLPPDLTRAQAVERLHDHDNIIRANPLVINHRTVSKPDRVPSEESHYIWYEITDRITYLPGYTRDVVYHGGFLDTPDGVTTHVYAPAGLEIRERWSICEARDVNDARKATQRSSSEASDLGEDQLVLCEDLDMTCSILLAAFVKKELLAAHKKLTQKLFGIE